MGYTWHFCNGQLVPRVSYTALLEYFSDTCSFLVMRISVKFYRVLGVQKTTERPTRLLLKISSHLVEHIFVAAPRENLPDDSLLFSFHESFEALKRCEPVGRLCRPRATPARSSTVLDSISEVAKERSEAVGVELGRRRGSRRINTTNDTEDQ